MTISDKILISEEDKIYLTISCPLEFEINIPDDQFWTEMTLIENDTIVYDSSLGFDDIRIFTSYNEIVNQIKYIYSYFNDCPDSY
jgi:hypothetical protein